MTTDIEQATVERMAALVRDLADKGREHDGFRGMLVEARAIAALLPPLVDPDLVTARCIVAEHMQKIDDSLSLDWVDAVMRGQMDNGNMVRIALAALRKAREEGAGK